MFQSINQMRFKSFKFYLSIGSLLLLAACGAKQQQQQGPPAVVYVTVDTVEATQAT
jgi:hypothetical protein